ncbi:hypothetical protein NW762_011574 [Fusarium torreyae]|uniref:AAA+ ATPase domain-containing protein n=1 Tax=Fusarium torreyae TaxID=1237075 RepID=A0A9W8RQF7_9HYPO|nr:hypothetical protein NW762_011574 [Fusarium torreyae]
MSSDVPDETGRTSPWSEVSPPVMTPCSNSSPIDDEKNFVLEVSGPATIEEEPNVHKEKEEEGKYEHQAECDSVEGAEDKTEEEERCEEEAEEGEGEHEGNGQGDDGEKGEEKDKENHKQQEEQEQEVQEEAKEETKPRRIKEWTAPLVKHIDPELMDDESPSRLKWLRQKREHGEQNEAMDEIMSMVGIEKVKAHFLWAKERAEIAKRWKEDMRHINFDLVIHGGDGTGKKRIAQLYTELLFSIGAVCRRKFRTEDKQVITEQGKDHATVMFFPNAEWFESTDDMEQVMSYVNKRKDKVVIILAFRSLTEKREASLAATSDSRRRFCNRIVIDDYEKVEIMQFLNRLLKKKIRFETKAATDTFLGIVAHRVLKQKKATGSSFDNANAIKELFDKTFDEMFNRKKQRLESEWMKWTQTNTPKDNQKLKAVKPRDEFTLKDIVGPEPSTLKGESKAWNELQRMIGLDSVKKEISDLLHLIDYNRQCEQQGKQGIAIPLNRFIMGAPGVGKTTLAELYAEILSEGGLLSKGNIIVKTASALIGQHTGESEEKTTQALEEAKGGILIIDNAHMLYKDCSDGEDTDSYRQGIIDTLAANVSGEPDEDRSVILCGYAEELEKMVLNANQGLQRRFPLEYAIKLDSYTDDELSQILDKMLMAGDGVTASEMGLKVARCMLSRMRTGPKFGNASAVQNLLVQARIRRMRRLKNASIAFADMQGYELTAEDFDPDCKRWFSSNTSNKDLFQGFVGFDRISGQFERYQKIANGMRRHNIDPRPHIPSSFIFKGPPGTGKTSAAKEVGTIFYDLGFLSSDEVVVCSVTDLVGQYTGQTGPKVRKLFERGLGKVLFIDEAYQLNGGDSTFHQEAVGEIVDIMTKPKYAGNMVVILAGYDDDMERLLRTNSGLRSRFPTIVNFTSMTPEHCLKHLIQCLDKLKIQILDPTADQDQRAGVLEVFERLRETGEWANGRDVETLAQRIIGHVFVKEAEIEDGSEGSELVVSFGEVREYLEMMLEERGGEL